MFELSCVTWKQPACNGKNPPTHFCILKKIINSFSEWAVSDSTSVHVTEGKKSCPFVMLPCRHSPDWEAVVRTVLSVAAGDIYG